MKTIIQTFAIVISITFFLPQYGVAQQNRAKNHLYVEALGNALFYSVNYERALSEKLLGRVGFSFYTIEGEALAGREQFEGNGTTIPIMINYLSGSGNGHLELGGGIAVYSTDVDNPSSDFLDFNGSTLLFTGTVGYRYQQPGGGFLFKLSFTPLTNFEVVLPWLGAGIGYSF